MRTRNLLRDLPSFSPAKKTGRAIHFSRHLRTLGRKPATLSPLLFCLAGCAFTGQLPVPTLAKISGGSLTYYHAYGDSITYGFALPDRLTQAYPVLISVASGIPLTNLALAGDQACDVPKRQIFPAQDNPTLAKQGLYTILISTNDVDNKGKGPYEAVFNLCHQAAISWLAVPEQFKVLATSSSVTSSGTVSIETQNNWNALATNGQNASVNFNFSRTTAGPVYVWYRIVDGSSGTFSYSLDGEKLGSGTTATTPVIYTENGSNNSLSLLRISEVTAGSHSLSFVQTNEGTDGVSIVGIGLPPGTPLAGMPRVLVGTTPRQESDATCGHSDNPCGAYIADITANVALIAGDGLDVELFDSRKYTTGTGADMEDAIHPNPLGHYEIALALAEVLQ